VALGLTLRQALVLLIAYLGVGVIAYSFVLENWSIVDSLYFTSVCFSTVGYGDLCPSNPLSKFFTCVFGFGGLAFLGAAVAVVGSSVVQAEIDAVQTARKESRKRLMQLFEGMPAILKLQKPSKAVLSTQYMAQIEKNRPPVPKLVTEMKNILRSVAPVMSIVVLGGLIMRYLNKSSWSIGESIYFALVTASTVGFGDYSPTNNAAKIFSLVFIPVSVAGAGELLSGVALSWVRRRQRELFEQQLKRDLTIEQLRLMDTDKDEKITKDEYVRFMLVQMGLVQEEELEELSEQFDRLDLTGSGYLDKEDLKLMAELRGAAVEK
jgi:hypothetical protein